MKLQEALRNEPAHNGHIAYHFRAGKYTYFLGYGANSVVSFESDTSHDQWSDAKLQEVLDLFRLKSESGDKND